MPGRRGEPPPGPPREDPPALGEGQRERSSGLCLSLGLAALSPPQITHARRGQEGPLPPGLACLPLRPSSRPQARAEGSWPRPAAVPTCHRHRAAADPADPSRGLWPQRERYSPAAILAASWKQGPPSLPSGPGWIPKPRAPPILRRLPASPWGSGTCLDPLPTLPLGRSSCARLGPFAVIVLSAPMLFPARRGWPGRCLSVTQVCVPMAPPKQGPP